MANGQNIDSFLIVGLADSQKEFYKAKLRVRAFNFINDSKYLRGNTAIPGWHIDSLVQVEIDLVIHYMLSASLTYSVLNNSDWAESYRRGAMEQLKKMKYDASVEPVTADTQNTGNGTLVVTPNDDHAQTENWMVEAASPTTFYAKGDLTGGLPEITVGTQYPEKDKWPQGPGHGVAWDEFPVSILITQGVTEFTAGDRFTFTTYSSSSFNSEGHIKRG